MTTAKNKSPSHGVVLRKDTAPHSAKLVPREKGSHKGKGVEIRLKSKTWKTLARQRGQMKDLIETYGAAVAKSRRLRKSVGFVVRIGAGGEPHFRPLEDEPPREAEPTTNGSGGELQTALGAARERGQARVADSPKWH